MHRPIGRKASAKWLAFAAFIALTAIPLETAQAHAKVISSSPSPGEHLSKSPGEIRIVFSEPPVAAMSRIVIVMSDGKEIALATRTDSTDSKALIANVPQLAPGSYSVSWRVIPSDGHASTGQIPFAIEAMSAQPDSSHPADSIAPAPHLDQPSAPSIAFLPAVLRGAALACLLAACGLLGFTAYSESGGSDSQQRLIRWLIGAATIVFIVHFAAWMAYLSPTGTLERELVKASIASGIGTDELMRVILCALTAWAVILARRGKIAFAFALAAVIAGGMMGHPAAHHPVAAIPIKALHLVAVAFWMGGVLWLITNREESLEAASSVSRIAIVSISIVALSGVVETLLFVDAVPGRIGLLYAILLIAKIAGLFVLAAFGTYHRNMIKRGTVGAPFRKSLKRENAVMVAIVMIAGFLAYVPLS
jgi:copper transport protein